MTRRNFWGVVLSQPNAEARVSLNLTRQGFDHYWPKIKIERVAGGRKTTIPRSLFSRYLFVCIHDQWRQLLSTYGVSQVIMNGDAPAAVSEQTIRELKSREVGGFVALPEKDSAFKIGQGVRVESGKFVGLMGLYQGMSPRQRELVLLNILGRAVRVELAAGDLIA